MILENEDINACIRTYLLRQNMTVWILDRRWGVWKRSRKPAQAGETRMTPYERSGCGAQPPGFCTEEIKYVSPRDASWCEKVDGHL